MKHRDQVLIGDPVERQVVIKNGLKISYEWKPATVHHVSDAGIGITYADSTKEMLSWNDSHWRRK